MEQQQSQQTVAPAPALPTPKKRKRKSVVYSSDALGRMKKGRLISLVLSLQEELQQLKNGAKGSPKERKKEGKTGEEKKEEVSHADKVRLSTKKLVDKVVKAISSTSMTTATNTMFRPFVTVETEMEGDIATAIIGNLGEEKKNSNRYLVRKLDKGDLQLMLPDLPEQCDVMYSAEASLMTTATLQTVEFKFDKKYQRLSLKFRIARARGAGIFSTAELFDNASSEGEENEEKEKESSNQPQDAEAKTSDPVPKPTTATESKPTPTTSTPGAETAAKPTPVVPSA